MNNDELIGKARKYLNDLLARRPLSGLTAEMFTESNVSQMPVVSFSCKDREDVIELFIDPHSGDVREVNHTPNKRRKKPE